MTLAIFRHERHEAIFVRTESIVSILPVVDEVGVKIAGLSNLDIAGRENPIHVLGDPREVAEYVAAIEAGEVVEHVPGRDDRAG